MKRKKGSILIVDEDAGIRLALEALLAEEFVIYCAEDGRQAARMAWGLDLDVALIDVATPNLEAGRLLSIRKASPAILLTATSDWPSEFQNRADLGIYGCIRKPWDVGVLRHLILAAVAQRRWERSRWLYPEIQIFEADWLWCANGLR